MRNGELKIAQLNTQQCYFSIKFRIVTGLQETILKCLSVIIIFREGGGGGLLHKLK